MQIETPFTVLEIVFQRKYAQYGFLYRREIVDNQAGGTVELKNCYSLDTGQWIGNSKVANFLCRKKGLRQLQKTNPRHSVCSIGFSEDEQKWYGWSHRAICGFGIDDKLFEEKYGDEHTPFVEHGEKTIESLGDAKLAASRFASSVS